MTSPVTLHIFAPKPLDRSIRRIDCPTCGKRRFMACLYFAWLGGDATCLRCGDRWQDGELCPRPFRRGWRKKAVEACKRQWRAQKGVA